VNPFTRFLSQFMPDHDLDQFVAAWDGLEQLVIRVYKAQHATAEDEREFGTLQDQLRSSYPQWATQLRPFWQATLVGGKLAQRDPFERLFSAESAAAFVDDWDAMQHLPAAREALNRFIVAESADSP
jgi:hypothetical protein